jgi:hypothetical protein
VLASSTRRRQTTNPKSFHFIEKAPWYIYTGPFILFAFAESN